MSAFVETYPFITDMDVKPVYLRRAVIAVPKGNPKNIKGIQDLLDKPSRIVVTEGLEYTIRDRCLGRHCRT